MADEDNKGFIKTMADFAEVQRIKREGAKQQGNIDARNKLITFGPFLIGLIILSPLVFFGWQAVIQIGKLMRSPVFNSSVPTWVAALGIVVVLMLLTKKKKKPVPNFYM